MRWIVEAEGLALHEGKTRILRRGRRPEVTDVVVGERTTVARATLRRFRALLFQLEKDGPVGKSWGERRDDAVLASVVGFAIYVAMVDPARGRPLLARARAVASRHGEPPRWDASSEPSPSLEPALPAFEAAAEASVIEPLPTPQVEELVVAKKKSWRLF